MMSTTLVLRRSGTFSLKVRPSTPIRAFMGEGHVAARPFPQSRELVGTGLATEFQLAVRTAGLGVDHIQTGLVQRKGVLRGQKADVRHDGCVAPGRAIAVRGHVDQKIEEAHLAFLAGHRSPGVLHQPFHKGHDLRVPVHGGL